MATLIELRDVHKVYRAGGVAVHAIQGISLSIKRGEFVSIMGPSGSGKSSLLHIIGCLDRATRGQYFLDGIDVSSLSRDSLADIRNQRIGFVFQAFNLIPRTNVIENVEMPAQCSSSLRTSGALITERATACLARVGLSSHLHHFPNQLSGGQQQRVAIARALVNAPDIVIADEPTGNLDSHCSAEIMRIFQDLNGSGITILMVTHEPEMAEYSQRILYLRDGLVEGDDSYVASVEAVV